MREDTISARVGFGFGRHGDHAVVVNRY